MDRRKSSVISVNRVPDGVLRHDDKAIHRLSVANPDVATMTNDARDATEREHNLTIRDALRLYPKAVMFSIAFSTAVIMEGYDLSLVGSLMGYPSFKARYGTAPDPENPGKKLIGSAWQSGIHNGVQVRLWIRLF